MKNNFTLPLVALTCFLLTYGLNAQVSVAANTSDGVSAYTTFDNAGYGVEGPDDSSSACAAGGANDAGNHKAFGEHVLEVADATLGMDVFAFVSHIDDDSDRCVNFDRVRMEIKGGPAGQSDPGLEHQEGDETHYRWQFRLPADFQGSSSFCHLFQNKAQGGSETGFPVLTLTARTSVMELIHAPQDAGSSAVDLEIVPLQPFLGRWVEVYMRQVHSNNGELEVLIQDVETGDVLMSHLSTNIDMFRTGASINRPKWGIYRKFVSGLKDETVHFASFCASENGDVCPTFVTDDPDPAETTFSTPLAVAASRKKRTLTWGVSNQTNSDYFSVERGADGQSFSEIAQVQAAGQLTAEQLYSYADGESVSGPLFYRISLVNLDGSTLVSNTVEVTTSGGGGGGGGGNGGGKPGKKSKLYPNPVTANQVNVLLTQEHATTYRVMTLLGQEAQRGRLFPGTNRLNLEQLPRGTYLFVIAGEEQQVQRIVLN